MARALPIILAEFQKPENGDAIKVAALIGLSRHLEWDPHRAAGSTPIPAALRTQIINELLALAQAKDPPAGATPKGICGSAAARSKLWAWRATPSSKPPVADAFDQILQGRNRAACAALHRRHRAGPNELSSACQAGHGGTVKELGYLALVACDAELNRIKNLKETEEQRSARISGESRGGSAARSHGPGRR